MRGMSLPMKERRVLETFLHQKLQFVTYKNIDRIYTHPKELRRRKLNHSAKFVLLEEKKNTFQYWK